MEDEKANCSLEASVQFRLLSYIEMNCPQDKTYLSTHHRQHGISSSDVTKLFIEF